MRITTTRLTLPLAALCLLGGPARAQNWNWIADAPWYSDWSLDLNWAAAGSGVNGVPQPGDSAYLLALSGAPLPFGRSTTTIAYVPMLDLATVVVDRSGSLGPLGVSQSLAFSAQNLTVGESGSASWVLGVTGSPGSTVSNNIAASLVLGRNAGSSGAFLMQDGAALSVLDETIGAAGTGRFTQSAGNHIVNGTLILAASGALDGNGVYHGAVGSYTLQAGTLTVANEVVGSGGGSFDQSGGGHVVQGTLTVGNATGVQLYGTNYHLSGSSTLEAYAEVIGVAGGSGFFLQEGGTHTVDTDLTLGNAPGTFAQYRLWGGTLNVKGNVLGKENAAGWLIIAGGTLNMGQGSRLESAYFAVGDSNANRSGTFTYDGSFDLAPAVEEIGNGATGVFTQTAGTNVTQTLSTGRTGTYDLRGGTLQSDAIYNYGTMNVSGGGIAPANGYLVQFTNYAQATLAVTANADPGQEAPKTFDGNIVNYGSMSVAGTTLAGPNGRGMNLLENRTGGTLALSGGATLHTGFLVNEAGAKLQAGAGDTIVIDYKFINNDTNAGSLQTSQADLHFVGAFDHVFTSSSDSTWHELFTDAGGTLEFQGVPPVITHSLRVAAVQATGGINFYFDLINGVDSKDALALFLKSLVLDPGTNLYLSTADNPWLGAVGGGYRAIAGDAAAAVPLPAAAWLLLSGLVVMGGARRRA